MTSIGQKTIERAYFILKMLPEPIDDEWEEQLSEWEQKFVTDIRARRDRSGPFWSISEKQYEVLERIWEKTNK